MLNRFYAICNCCKCCCLGMKSEHHIPMLLPSGYRAVIGDGCIGCGLCTGYCQFEALEILPAGGKGAKRCHVLDEKCYGCGIRTYK